MNDDQSSTINEPSRRRLIRLSGGMIAGTGMASLAGCGLPGGGEEDGEEGGDGEENGGGGGEGGGEDD